MKAERKHAVDATEDLSGSMNELGKWIQDNLNTIGLGVVLAVVAFLAYSLIFAEKPIDAPAGDWSKYMLALSDNNAEKELQVFIEDAVDQRSAPVVQAKLSLGEIQLASGVRQLFEDRQQATELLEKSRKNLSDVESAAQDALTRNRARLGLATIAESQNKPEDAQRYYEQVSKSSGGESLIGKIAATEYKRIASSNSKDFLAWFAEQKPVPKKNPHMNSPLDPGFNLPETKDFSMPKLPENTRLDPLLPGLPAGGEKQAELSNPETTEKTPADKAPTGKEPVKEPAAENPPVEKEAESAADTPAAKAEETKASETQPAEAPAAANTPSEK